METYFYCKGWQETPAPTVAICCLTLVNTSPINCAFSPTFYVQALAFLLHSREANHFQATGIYRAVNLGQRSTTPTARSLAKQTARPWCLTLLNSPTR